MTLNIVLFLPAHRIFRPPVDSQNDAAHGRPGHFARNLRSVARVDRTLLVREPHRLRFQHQRRPGSTSPAINYHVGIDGLSLWLVLLTTLLTPIAVLVSWKHIDHRAKEFFAFLLLLEFGLIGVFIALDLFLFFVFWEVSLVPMYFLIGIWGHERRIYATVKFFLYTMVGSMLMLAGIIYVYNKAGSFDYVEILSQIQTGRLVLRSARCRCCCSWLFSSPSRSRSRCSRCIPGCPTRTSKRPPPVPSCSLR